MSSIPGQKFSLKQERILTRKNPEQPKNRLLLWVFSKEGIPNSGNKVVGLFSWLNYVFSWDETLSLINT